MNFSWHEKRRPGCPSRPALIFTTLQISHAAIARVAIAAMLTMHRWWALRALLTVLVGRAGAWTLMIHRAVEGVVPLAAMSPAL
jgi:hypothetical protein